jgi:hypothetical protein
MDKWVSKQNIMKKKNLLLTVVATLCLASTTMAQVPNYVPSNGLVGWWPFTGNTNDESGNGNNASNNGATSTLDRFGTPNSAYLFDGVNDFMSLSSGQNTSLNVVGDISCSFWLNTVQTTYFSLITLGDNIGIDGGFLLNNIVSGASNDNPDKVSIWTSNNWITSETVWNDGQTNFFCITLGSNVLKLYKNGILDTTINNQPSVSSYSGNRYFGVSSQGNGAFLNGTLDDIGVWNRALTQDEITALYNGCNLNPTISPNPATTEIGANTNLSAASSDPTATYQWQTDPNNVGWQNVPNNATYSGASTSNLGVSNVQLGNHNQAFRVIATAGNCIDTSEVAFINVLDTCITNVIDTTFITINDTITTQVYDTTFVTETIYDTITTQVFDTTFVTQTIYDTLYVTETIYDTTYVTVNDTNYTYISVTDTLIINTTLGLVPNQQQNTIKVFPNPASTQITIDYGNFGLMNGYLVKITNNLGQIVYSANITQQSVTLNLGDWTGDGLYHLELFDSQNNVIENRKIVLQ